MHLFMYTRKRGIRPKQLGGQPLGESKQAERWSESTWRIFYKNRAHEIGLYDVIAEPIEPLWRSATLHFGFIGIEETEEQLALLRVYETTLPVQVARSKISRTVNFPQPINIVTARVIHNADIPSPALVRRFRKLPRLPETRETKK